LTDQIECDLSPRRIVMTDFGMRGILRVNGALGSLLTLSLLFLLLPGCARVTMEHLNTELAQIRQEIHAGDEAVEARVDQVDRRVRDMEGRMAALENGLSSLGDEYQTTVERLEAALRFNAPVHFAFDDATIQPGDWELLDRFASIVRAHYEDAIITVEGFTDPAGSAAYNLRLGEFRARAVKEYLVGQGLRENQIRVVSYGQDESRQIVPGAQGPGEEGWQNRRVSMVIDFRGSTTPPRVALPGDGGG
jgi:peptidoglycan-associated lipoprotein